MRAVGIAATHTRTAAPRVQALIASRQARAHARAGEHRACSHALSRAEDALNRAGTDPDEDPSWVYYFDRAELDAQAGACHIDLRDPRRAEPLLARALAVQDPAYVRDRTIYLARAARTHIQAGELDAACEPAGQAAELAHRSRSARSVQAVTDFRRSLKPHAAGPHVAALDQQLAALAA